MQQNFPVTIPAPAVPAVFMFESHEVSVVIRDGEPWFVAKDVATVLGYTDTTKARKHCKKAELYQQANLAGRLCEMYIIPESDVFRLAIKSTLPAAEKFEDWVMEEVLPSIRKTGSYVVANPATQPAISKDPLDLFLITSNAIQQIKAETDTRIANVEDEIQDIKNSRPLLPHQCRAIQVVVAEKVSYLSGKYGIYRKILFSSIYGFLKRTYNVNTYSAIASLRFDEVLSVIKNLVLEQLPENVIAMAKGV